MHRGRLDTPDTAPSTGERTTELLRRPGLLIEHILSGEVDRTDYRQPHDEWVVVLAGRGRLEVAGEAIALEPGEWMLIPADTPHTLVETVPGTAWLAVHHGL